MEILNDVNNRHSLFVEATPVREGNNNTRNHVKAIRCVAIAEMWRTLLQSAITCVHLIIQGKSKLTLRDLRLPFTLLKLCDQPDEVFPVEDGKLGKNESKILYKYCINMLRDQKVLDIDGAELELLSMLSYICKRRELVAYFKPQLHVPSILEHAENCLLTSADSEEMNSCLEVLQAAAAIFCNLLTTCHNIGISLHLVLPRSFKFVAKWCSQTENGTQLYKDWHSIDALTYLLLSGLAVLMRSNPDLAVASLKRDGRPALLAARKRFVHLDLQKAAKAHVTILTEFLSRYM